MTACDSAPPLPIHFTVIIAIMKKQASGRVVVVGSSNTDLVLHCKHLPRAGETVLGGRFQTFAGGKGANQAVAAARAGAKVTFIGAHGNDDYGRTAKRGLQTEGIATTYFKPRAGYSSGIALIFIGGKGNDNIIGVAQSANDTLGAIDVQAARNSFKQAAVVMAQLEIPLEAVLATAEQARESGALFMLNPAPARKLPAKLLKLVNLITPNQTEAELLTGESDPARAALELQKRGVERVAVTLGARGALLCDENGTRTIKAPKVKPVDTVGAGDCFNGYLAAGLTMNKSFDEAAHWAVLAAAIAVTRAGAQSGMPQAHEVQEFESPSSNR